MNESKNSVEVQVEVGEILSNGAEVLAIKAYDANPANCYLAFVLCKTDSGQFVTWLYNEYGKGCHNGHYFDKNLLAAVEDFHKRD